MKIKLLQFSVLAYFILTFIFLKTFSVLSIVLLAATFFIDIFTSLRRGIKNLLYLLAALSIFVHILYIFLVYLPFVVFGFLFSERNFLRDYVLGFAASFIPSTFAYLVSTYLSIPLSKTALILIFYFLPLVAFAVLKKKSLHAFEIDDKSCIFALIILFFTIITAISIVDDRNLFMANGSREYYRVQNAVNGLHSTGLVPIYDPTIGSGEATYLWVTPTYIMNFAVINYFLGFINPILFFNEQSLFILFLSTLALGVFFFSLLNREKSELNMLAVAAVTLLTGLNFFFLQSLEAIKQYYMYPLAYLLLALILENPKRFNEYAVIMMLSVFSVILHPAYGLGVNILALCLFIAVKFYYLRDRTELAHFFKFLTANKLKVFVLLAIMLLLPLFYISSSIIFKNFLAEIPSRGISLNIIKNDVAEFFTGFYSLELHYLSLRYPDVNRIDDHKFGFFISVFGAASFALLIALYRLKNIKNFRIYAGAYALNLAILSLITASISVRVGGFYRTVAPFLLILLGASILTLLCITGRKYIKLIFIVIVFAGFLHTVPYASQNISNIHKEQFMSGDVYKEEIDFVRRLPIDGRIMTYGLFSNVVDYGISQFTGRYMSRNERIELAIERTIFDRIHDQNSFGEPTKVLTKSGTELANYLILGGYKYVFINICHPIGNYVAAALYPNFTYPIYQNNCMVFLLVNKTSYAEKTELAANTSPEIYRQEYGYRHVAISPYYNFNIDSPVLKEMPGEPQPLKFERQDPTTVFIYGNFNDNDFAVFKEQYFTRWKAYMNGREVPVLANNFDMIMVKTIKGSRITLKYSVLPIEKLFGMLSLTGFIGLSAFLIFLMKKLPA